MRVKTGIVFARIQIREESGLGLCWSQAPGDGVVGCDGLVWVGMDGSRQRHHDKRGMPSEVS